MIEEPEAPPQQIQLSYQPCREGERPNRLEELQYQAALASYQEYLGSAHPAYSQYRALFERLRTTRLNTEDGARVTREMSRLLGQLPTFNMAPHRRRYVAIVLHGLGQDPTDMDSLGVFLREQGVPSIVGRLPGHGSTGRELSRATREDWRRDLEALIRQARNFGDNIILVGFSTGGTLALERALTNPNDAAGLMLFAPAVEVSTLPAFAAFIGDMLGISGRRNDGITFSGRAGREVVQLTRELRGSVAPEERFASVRTPTFLAQSLSDDIVETYANRRMWNSLPHRGNMILELPEAMGVSHTGLMRTSSQETSELVRSNIIHFLNANFADRFLCPGSEAIIERACRRSAPRVTPPPRRVRAVRGS